MASANPEQWMRRAVALSRRGFPAPNPHVGCVLVKDGRIIAEGWHRHAGGPHAEAEALRIAGPLAEGSTAYVTLEPCSHHGRQPPCTEALIRTKVSKVVFAVRDPNPKVEGGGAERLREAGVEVEQGILDREAALANWSWLWAMRQERPFVTLKAAMSLDGRIALPCGDSHWITGERARTQARRLRAEMGAVLVGSGTAIADDPRLDARLNGVKNEPVKILLDPERHVPGTLRLFQGAGPVMRVTQKSLAQPGDLGMELHHGEFVLSELMAVLWERGITGVLVEGGAATLSSFLRQGLADRLDLFVGNVVLGRGLSWVEAALSDSMEGLARWRLESAKRLDEDVWLRYTPKDCSIEQVLA